MLDIQENFAIIDADRGRDCGVQAGDTRASILVQGETEHSRVSTSWWRSGSWLNYSPPFISLTEEVATMKYDEYYSRVRDAVESSGIPAPCSKAVRVAFIQELSVDDAAEVIAQAYSDDHEEPLPLIELCGCTQPPLMEDSDA